MTWLNPPFSRGSVSSFTAGLVSLSQLLGCAESEPETSPEPEVSAQAPVAVEGAPAASEPGRSFVVTAFRLGDQDDAGVSRVDAWERFGFDLDGTISHGAFADHCRPALGGAADLLFEDGPGGIDNSFGRNLVPMIKFVFAEAGADLDGSVNASIGRATSGLVLRTAAFSSSPDASGIDAVAFAAWSAAEGPAWEADMDAVADADPGDVDGSIARAHAAFAGGYLSGDALVLPAGPDAYLDLRLDVKSSVIPLRVHRPLVAVRMDEGHTRASGVLAGVLYPGEAESHARFALASADPSFCEGTAIAGVINQVGQTPDLLADAGQDPARVCDGISFAIGIELETLVAPVAGLAARPLPDPCAQPE